VIAISPCSGAVFGECPQGRPHDDRTWGNFTVGALTAFTVLLLIAVKVLL
jgi:hypothetical protein